MTDRGYVKPVILVVMGLVLLAGLFVGAAAGCKEYNRYQRRADVSNEIKVRNTQVEIAKKDVQVAEQQANVRYAQSVGIRRAQDEIAKTLTPLYVQHEAIEAQVAMAKYGATTQVYIPSGAQGVPIVATAPEPPVKTE